MKKKTASGLLLTLLLLGTLTLAFDIQAVKGSGTIYIRPDGTVEGTDKIHRDGDVYTFTDNIYDTYGIVVQRDNIVVNGASYTIQGMGTGQGIDLSGRTNVTVKNVKIAVFWYGISLSDSSNNSISGNYVANNELGISILGSSYNVLRNNSMVGNRVHFGVWGDWFSSSIINDVDVSNTVDGKPIYYWVNKHYAVVPNDAGFVALLNSTNIRVEGLDDLEGIVLVHTINTTITQNNITSDISLDPSSNHNSISGNNITGGIGIGWYGIECAANNTISRNNITGSIGISCSVNTTISGNNITGGVDIMSYSCNNTVSGNNISGHIYLYISMNNAISGNNVTDGGIWCYDNALDNTISGNNVTDGGISLARFCNDNTVSENNITGSGIGILLQMSSSNNVMSRNVIKDSVDCGIFVEGASKNDAFGNYVENNGGDGIVLSWYVANSIVSGNIIVGNGESGIVLDWVSSNNTVSENNVMENNGDGIVLSGSSNNTISGNKLKNNGESGIVLDLIADNYFGNLDSENNIIAGNDIRANNQYGIQLFNSSDNSIYHNNFVDNADQVYSENSANFWDDGYPSGGNYWSDHVTVDDYSGMNQDEPGGDGIVDEPYIIDYYNRDHYPLVEPWSPVISATVDVAPDTLHLSSAGRWITCHIELPEGYNVADIDVSTIMLNDTIPVSLLDVPAPDPVPTEIGDYDNDTIPDLMVNFKTTLVSAFILSQRITSGVVTLTITGGVNGTPFEGTDTIRVLMSGGGTGRRK